MLQVVYAPGSPIQTVPDACGSASLSAFEGLFGDGCDLQDLYESLPISVGQIRALRRKPPWRGEPSSQRSNAPIKFLVCVQRQSLRGPRLNDVRLSLKASERFGIFGVCFCDLIRTGRAMICGPNTTRIVYPLLVRRKARPWSLDTQDRFVSRQSTAG